MSKEQFTPQSNEDDRPVIEIPKSVVKIGAVALATLGLAGAANTLGLFYSPNYQKIQKFALSHLKREKTRLRWPKQPWKNTTRKILKIR